MSKRINNLVVDEIEWERYKGVVVFHPQLGWIMGINWCENCKKFHVNWLIETGFGNMSGMAGLGWAHPEGTTLADKFERFRDDIAKAIGPEIERVTFHLITAELHERAGEIRPVEFGLALEPPPTLEFMRLLEYLRKEYEPTEAQIATHEGGHSAYVH